MQKAFSSIKLGHSESVAWLSRAHGSIYRLELWFDNDRKFLGHVRLT
jgi:hypothetical protein